MLQTITLNITYYITKYFYTHPLLKMLFVISLAIIVRNTLDITNNTNLVFCLDEDITQETPLVLRSALKDPSQPFVLKHVSFDSTIEQNEHATIDKNRVMRWRRELAHYRSTAHSQKIEIRQLRGMVEEQNRYVLETHVTNGRLIQEVQCLQVEKKDLARDLAITKSKLSRFGRLTAQLEERGVSFNFFKRTKR